MGVVHGANACTSPPSPTGRYLVHAINGATPLPATAFRPNTVQESQLMWGELDFSTRGKAIFRWQHRFLTPGHPPDTLGVGVDTFLLHQSGSLLLLSRYSMVLWHGPDSVLVVDTVSQQGDELIFRRKVGNEDGSISHWVYALRRAH